MAHLPEYKWVHLNLPDRYFRWRIRGNPLSWCERAEFSEEYDLVVATSMVDLATLKGLIPPLSHIPSIVYFHENQFAFPVSSQQHGSIDPQMVNLYAAMAADAVVFNSEWNRMSFISGVTQLLKQLPDCTPVALELKLQDKSRVIPVPIADDYLPACQTKQEGLTLLWAARWEYDKGPDRLLAALNAIEVAGFDYQINIIGQQFRKVPDAFKRIEQLYSHRLNQFGFLPDRSQYKAVLQSSDVFISTAIHEFQGLSALEAAACGCVPLVPNRLSYPELFSQQYCYSSYGSDEDSDKESDVLVEKLHVLLEDKVPSPDVSRYQWQYLTHAYRTLIQQYLA
ncbi:MAG: glycosyltransferase involved in cell wall biosynthesis [Pseudohongiellaceae bacterium]|jgi:glycosyltransferase involved in cell wall biosynthesis